MKTLKKVPIKPVCVEFIPPWEEMEEGTIYISVEYKTASHKCLCGCGSPTITPMTKDMWSFNLRNGKLSISPSIGNFQFPCKSHYIITNNIANFV